MVAKHETSQGLKFRFLKAQEFAALTQQERIAYLKQAIDELKRTPGPDEKGPEKGH